MKLDTMHDVRKYATRVAAAAAVLLSPAIAHAEVTLSFDPLNGVITHGVPPETLTVAVTVDTAADTLKGFSVVLEFDPTYVTPISVAPGAFLLSGGCTGTFLDWQNETAIGDSIAVDGASLGCDGVVGSGHLFEVDFIGVENQYGISPLACRDVRLRDQYNVPLTYTCNPGTIEHKIIIISTVPETWGRMKALYR